MDQLPAESMHHFSDLLVLLGIAGLTVPFLHRLKISPVLGFLFCGILMGPYGFSVFSGDDVRIVEKAANLGIIFLMFMIGLNLSLQDLWRLRRDILGLGGGQILLTGGIVFLVARHFENSTEMAILLGACFALSSTAVVMQLLEEREKTHTPVGRLCFSILLMQDLAVVPILTLLTAFAGKTDESLIYLTGRALFVAVVSIITIYVVGTRLMKPLLLAISPAKHPDWLISFVLFLVLGTAMLTEKAGLSAALGAFLAGLLLAETEYKRDIQAVIFPVKGLLMGVFFLSVGMMVDLGLVRQYAGWVFLSVVGIGAIKAVVLFGLCLAFKMKKAASAEAAIMLGQGGEFVFVIVTLALAYRIIPVADAHFFMAVTAMSMLATPFVALLAPTISRRIAAFLGEKNAAG